jgi:hypothetical protein
MGPEEARATCSPGRPAIVPSKRVAFSAFPRARSKFAVGTALTGGPPHRSQRALLTHWAPASGSGVEAHRREWMLHAGRW